MTDLDTRLDQALKADAAPGRDPMFRIRLLERREQASLRRRLWAGCGAAFGAAVVGALGLAVTQTVLNGTELLAATAAIGAAMTAAVAAPYLGGRATLRNLAARAAWGLRTLPRLNLWS
jgi:hypothetical protein